jgi:hypothetical protein
MPKDLTFYLVVQPNVDVQKRSCDETLCIQYQNRLMELMEVCICNIYKKVMVFNATFQQYFSYVVVVSTP